MSELVSSWRESIEVYDAIAADYDGLFTAPGYRHSYDRLAGEYVSRLLPAEPGVIVDAGCGTGRWSSQWLALGHRVIGIEQSPQMIAQVHKRKLGDRFCLIEDSMDKAVITPGSVDLVVALGSLHYLADPGLAMRRFAEWLKPGGWVCVYTDSLAALVLELLRLGKQEEALLRLKTRRGVWLQGDTTAELHLYDREAMENLFRSAGLIDIACSGLLVTASAWDKARSAEAAIADEEAFLDLERTLMADPAMADAGKHIIARGRRPA